VFERILKKVQIELETDSIFRGLILTGLVPLCILGAVLTAAIFNLEKNTLERDLLYVERNVNREFNEFHEHTNRLSQYFVSTLVGEKHPANIQNKINTFVETIEFLDAVFRVDSNNEIMITDQKGQSLGGVFQKNLIGENHFKRNTDSATNIFLVNGIAGFYQVKKFEKGHMVFRYSLSNTSKKLKSFLNRLEPAFAAMVPLDNVGDQIGLIGQTKEEYWESIAALTLISSEAYKHLDGNLYNVKTILLPKFQTKLIIATDFQSTHRLSKITTLALLAIVLIFLLAANGLIVLKSQKIVQVREKIRTLFKLISSGDRHALVSKFDHKEFEDIREVMNQGLQNVYSSISSLAFKSNAIQELTFCVRFEDLFPCSIALFRDECHADLIWFCFDEGFLSRNFSKNRTDEKGWHWTGQTVLPLVDDSETSAIKELQGHGKMYEFVLRSQNEEIGTFNIFYYEVPNELVDLKTTALMALIELTIQNRLEITKHIRGLGYLEFAASLNKPVVLERAVKKQAKISHHYQVGTNIGNEWFQFLEEDSSQVIHVIMGRLLGNDVAHGVAAASVRGALCVMEAMVRKEKSPFFKNPSHILKMINQVAEKAAGIEALAIEGMVVKIDFANSQLVLSNSGFESPMLLRNNHEIMIARSLSEESSEIDEFGNHRYALEPDDIVILSANSFRDHPIFKMEVFKRMIVRFFRQEREYLTADQIKDKIISYFEYYTQSQRLPHDVCFVVLKFEPRGFSSANKKIDESA